MTRRPIWKPDGCTIPSESLLDSRRDFEPEEENSTNQTHMKNYEVRIIAFATVLVIEAEDEEQASMLACDQIDMGNLELDEARTMREVPDDDLANTRRHADFVVKAD